MHTACGHLREHLGGAEQPLHPRPGDCSVYDSVDNKAPLNAHCCLTYGPNGLQQRATLQEGQHR